MRGLALGLVLAVGVISFGAMPSNGQMMDMSGSIKAQLKTAAYHAGELAQKGAIAATKLHLQHVINCLEGPSGAHYQQAAGYPCQNQGHGILPDLKAAVAGNISGARASWQDANIALTLALQAQGMTDVLEAQPWSKVVAEYLNKASSDLQ